MIGYSLSGYTALLNIGASPTLTELEGYCRQNSAAELLCSPWSAKRFSAAFAELNSSMDACIGAAVLLAPGYGPFFTRQSLAEINVPVKIFSAEKDEELDNRYHAQHIASLLPGKVEHEVIAGAGHYVFMLPCPQTLRRQLPAFICNDAEDIDRTAIHEDMNAKIHDFFQEVL